ncbi:head-tail adaptor protein [Faecalispora jeddahensis]|uniref:phage head completion protein n=1 Tax=Faecalispora jeddahensis TaxID=1414721 RepID=UPI0018989B1A|nr:head-tail adaptor protein [Faecalispora jeddahensis]MDU6306630.1 head-tail adaptor protein [Clostridium sp.]MDU6348299.1 head-tail adaptor protein [Clostridium sp.]
MQAGDLNRPVSILQLTQENMKCDWTQQKETWAKVEQKSAKNLFSQVGIGADTVIFTVRKQEITLHNAIRWRGEHYFLTNIAEDGGMYYMVTAARVYIKTCAVTHVTTTKNELKNPVAVKSETITFPAVLTEKYLGFEQREPQAVTETTYVLVTPKVIELSISDLVDVAGKKYCVQVAHTLDEFKNEYEITNTQDV